MTFLGGDRGWATRHAIERVAGSLSGTLEPGETVESAFFAHRYVPGLSVLFAFGAIGDAVYVLIARPYYVALTNRRFFLLKGGWGFWPSVGDPVITSAADSVRMDEPRRFVVRKTTTVHALGGAEMRLAVQRVYWSELDRMRSLLSAG